MGCIICERVSDLNRTCSKCGGEVCVMHRTPFDSAKYLCHTCDHRRVKTIQQGLFQTLLNDGLPQVKFTHNWNNKLNCTCFTTIRPWDPERFKVGQVYLIRHTDKLKARDITNPFRAELVTASRFQLANLPEITAALDTGYSRQETLAMMQKMYQEAETIPFGIYLFRRAE